VLAQPAAKIARASAERRVALRRSLSLREEGFFMDKGE
jgi:hypothetical protein